MSINLFPVDPLLEYALDSIEAIKEHIDNTLPPGVSRQWPEEPAEEDCSGSEAAANEHQRVACSRERAMCLLEVNTFESQQQYSRSIFGEIGLSPHPHDIQKLYGRIDAGIRRYAVLALSIDFSERSIRKNNKLVKSLKRCEKEITLMVESVEHLAYKSNRTNPKRILLKWVADLREALNYPE